MSEFDEELRHRRSRSYSDLSHADLVRLWGPLRVHCFDAARVDQLIIPADAKRVLGQVGLPVAVETVAPFFVDMGDDQAPEPLEIRGREGRWCRFGQAYTVVWCIESVSGEVWKLAADGSWAGQFANGSLDLFVASLYWSELYWRACEGVPDARVCLEIDRLEQVLSTLDPRAFGDEASLWPTFIYDVRSALGPH